MLPTDADSSLPKGYRALLLSIYCGFFLVNSSYSIIAPFFPQQAEQLGISVTIIGAIFSVFHVVVFTSSLVIGPRIARWGRKKFLVVGILIEGIAMALLGVLYCIKDRIAFIVLAFVLRAVQGFGSACSGTASFAIVAAEFPDRAGIVLGTLETFGGVGLMLGRPLGGLLYEAGGFILPFIIMGALSICMIPVFVRYVPADKRIPDDQYTDVSLLSLLKNMSVLIDLGAIFLCMCAFGFLDPTLAFHLESFKLQPAILGLVFAVHGFMYAIAAPLTGWLVDKTKMPLPIICLGLVVLGMSLIMLGPAPFVSELLHGKQLAVIIVALVLFGFGSGVIMIAVMPDMIFSAKSIIPENSSDAVSGLINGSLALGDTVGPMAGAFMTDHFGFAKGVFLFSLTIFFYAIIILVAIVFAWAKLRAAEAVKRELLEKRTVRMYMSAPPNLSSSIVSNEKAPLMRPAKVDNRRRSIL
eukprot:GILJ01002933.1.p1 GENE.GILJ01002933.1~~GILJ01002933.1.p1  ORF type:complete len:469 (+),score=58.53 GILJ01002933.1:38-1444(+)